MIHPVTHSQAHAPPSIWFSKVSAAAAMTIAYLLLAGALKLMFSVFWPAVTAGWLTRLQNNWLLVIFKLHAGFSDVQSSLLYEVNLLDLVILVLTAILYVGLYTALRNTSKIWSLVALAQPILGIALFLVTESAGRSAVMGAELVISLVMLRSHLPDKGIACIGVLSAILLLAGDIGAFLAPFAFLAIAMGAGYMLLVIWLFLVGRRLLHVGQVKRLE